MHQVDLHEYIPMTESGPHESGRYEFAWQGRFLRAFFTSDVGLKRKNNEDSCLLCIPEDAALAGRRGFLFAVADGMGGASAGEFASRMALRHTVAAYYKSDARHTPDALRAAVEDANLKVFEESEINPLLSGMGTTISVLVILGEWAYIAHVGDSRVYLLRNGGPLCQVTHDHSLVAEQMRCGLLTEEEARNHSLKNLITRAIGIKSEVKVDLYAVHVQKGDHFVMCSDGLSNMVKDEDIGLAMHKSDLCDAGRVLVETALDEGGSDNITAALLNVIDRPPKSELEPGIEEFPVPASGIMTRIRRIFG